jgi:hypothetical protein
MRIGSKKRIGWFSILALLVVCNLFFGEQFFPKSQALIDVVLILAIAISVLALFLIDRRSPQDAPLHDLQRVDDALRAEEEHRGR